VFAAPAGAQLETATSGSQRGQRINYGLFSVKFRGTATPRAYRSPRTPSRRCSGERLPCDDRKSSPTARNCRAPLPPLLPCPLFIPGRRFSPRIAEERRSSGRCAASTLSRAISVPADARALLDGIIGRAVTRSDTDRLPSFPPSLSLSLSLPQGDTAPPGPFSRADPTLSA